MAVRRILQLGDPLLRAVSREVNEASELLQDLQDTLHAFQASHGFGRGISAIQIGTPARVIYLEVEGRQYSLVNPHYESLSAETFLLWDDCFSFPDLMVKARRSVSVSLAYRDEANIPRTLQASGVLAELIQHEMDHLDGILAVDRALDRNSFMTREEWLRQGRPQPAGY
ncbi:MAG: peptide deformylase [Bryobacterales bacterium]|nr:peptide deformylase [Bryobacterales bacterium]